MRQNILKVKNTSPVALVLQPHPQYGGTMNNKVVVETFNTFMENDFSVCRVNFRGVGKSDGEFDNGQGELADAAAALDWLREKTLIILNVGSQVFLLVL